MKTIDMMILKDSLEYLRSTPTLLEDAREELAKMERKTQDLMHLAELNNLSLVQKRRLAEDLTATRKYRREIKDNILDLERLTNVVSKSGQRELLNVLEVAVDNTWLAQQRRPNRKYALKEMSEKEAEFYNQEERGLITLHTTEGEVYEG